TGLGGGGFMVCHKHKTRQDIVIDFFVNTPGVGCRNITPPQLIPVDIRFRSTIQRFYTGIGSVAVPGTLRGLIHCYKNFCTMDIGDIIRPALEYLEKGVEVTETMAYLLNILRPILTSEAYGREIFNVGKGDILYNPLLREFLNGSNPEQWLRRLYRFGHQPFLEHMNRGECLLTENDFRKYRVIERRPLIIRYRDYEIMTNPPPSFGGILLKLSLSLLNEYEISGMSDEEYRHLLASLMESTLEMKKDSPSDEKERFPFNRDIIMSAKRELDRIFRGVSSISTRGTTHISILDSDGNAASMTASNGSNSGCFFGDTGIMLNNMMGEDDLHPCGFYSLSPGRRVSSMMSPSLIRENGNIFGVMGSGGSKRIRTAIPQVIINLLDRGMDVRDAVEAPRLHLDEAGILQVEPGIDKDTIDSLNEHYDVNQWQYKDMYFGGVHTVLNDLTGHGDSRRGGCFMKVH
ncbi:MAG TPA: hypothetical protein ENH38_00355, partial [Nitrospirae bacterium]|nr:hypothetical protein [Nitrospirota bacterium]